MPKKIYQLGFIAYVCLFALAILLYRERTIFTDIAYHLFFIIKDGNLAIQNYRFGAAMTQVFPLAALMLGLSLKSMLIIYSTGFIIYYAACYYITGSVLKKYNYALIILFINILFVSHTFYWMQSELPQGLVFMIVLMAYASGEHAGKLPMVPLIFVALATCTIAFFHPLIIFAFTYSAIFLWLKKTTTKNNKVFYAMIVCYLLFVALKVTVFRTPYERGVLPNLHVLADRALHFFSQYSNRQFIHNCITKYYWVVLLSFIITYVYYSNKEWKCLVLFLVFMGGYIAMINLCYADESTTAFYIENMYLPISIFIALPFIYDVLPVLEKRKLAIVVVLLIIITGGIRIYTTRAMYTNRLKWEENFVAYHLDEKLIVAGKALPIDTVLISWGIPYEVWLLSTVKYNRTMSVAVRENVDEIIWAKDFNNQFITAWEIIPYAQLPKQYFKFEDSVATYKVIR